MATEDARDQAQAIQMMPSRVSVGKTTYLLLGLKWDQFEPTLRLRRIGYCLLPLALGMGAALVLLGLSGGPARTAYAGTLTFPGCAASIQGCIDIASPGDTILISAGDYTESLTLSKAVSLTGALSSTTTLHALPNTRVLTLTGAAVDSSVIISGLTFAGGHAVGGGCPVGCGGAILITATAQPLLINLTISNGLADPYGGGIYAATGRPLVMSGVAVLSNTGLFGGGLQIIAAPGETPGHQIVRIHAGGHMLYFLGDLYHHSVEVEHPAWMNKWNDLGANTRSRQALTERALREDALLFATHIPAVGRIRRTAAGVRWETV